MTKSTLITSSLRSAVGQYNTDKIQATVYLNSFFLPVIMLRVENLDLTDAVDSSRRSL